MLPEIGATELLVIAAVALIVVGPKDLPVLLRKLGQFMAKMRGMANDFRASFDEMARQSELDELRREVDAMRRGQLADTAALEASEAQINTVFQEIDDSLRTPAYTPNAYAEPADLPPLEQASKPKRAPARKKAPAAKASGAKAPDKVPDKAVAKPTAKTAAKPRTRKTGTVT
jgi:sec-independent protein translocase protein TatB